MELAVWRDFNDTSQLIFGEMPEKEGDEPVYLFSLFCCQAEAAFGLDPGALGFVRRAPVLIKLTLLVK